MTARWVVDDVQPARDLHVTWKPISLLFKNEPAEDSDDYAPVKFTHNLLRVLESVRAAGATPEAGNADVLKLYWEFGSRLHHDDDRDFTATEALEAVGLDTAHAKAFDDDSWDEVIRTAMDEGLALVGDDVGTPIIGMVNSTGEKVGYFGPVVNKVPDRNKGLAMWDGLVAMMDVDSFYELKRTRTGGLDVGERPEPR